MTAPALFVSLVVPVIAEYLERHPEVTASALLVDRVVNLVDEGAWTSACALAICPIRRCRRSGSARCGEWSAVRLPILLPGRRRRRRICAGTAWWRRRRFRQSGMAVRRTPGNRTVRWRPAARSIAATAPSPPPWAVSALVPDPHQVAGELAGRLTRLLADYRRPRPSMWCIGKAGGVGQVRPSWTSSSTGRRDQRWLESSPANRSVVDFALPCHGTVLACLRISI